MDLESVEHTVHNEDVDAILLDIEGTICPITFVKDVLFPYSIEALPEVLSRKWNDSDFKQYRDAFPVEYRSSPEAFRAHVEDITKRDLKIAYLKNLQGYIWKTGYETGAYATPLFPDVGPKLTAWRASSKDLVIYSSGSVPAQKLLFSKVKTDTASNPDPRIVNATEDLTNIITDWFDTINAGVKTEPDSYAKIAHKLGISAHRILFLSDSVKEVDAALESGMQAIIVVRSGNAALSDKDLEQHKIIKSFDEIVIS